MSPCKEIQKDGVFLSNGLDKGNFEIDQVNDVGFVEYNTIEYDFASPIPCINRTINEILYTHILEIR